MADQPTQSENDAAAEHKPSRSPIPVKTAAQKKSETARIDLAAAKPPPSIVDKKNLPADADDYFGRSTMRIEVGPSDKKSETARIELPPDAIKRKTSKIDLANAADIFKTETMAIGVPDEPPTHAAVSRTGKPKTIMVKRPGSASVPGESILVSPSTTASATEQARKSETARIDLSAEDMDRPATRPKTIRIKRPDGTSGRKPLAIARPTSEGMTEAPTLSSRPVESLETDDDPGLLAGITAIAALLVAGVLFYVLLAQTMAPNLPFPGKL